mmetsp:Transcript_55333/g.177431  ORF Transcript_55333/g.177431 Transcript_55333/m.177431 type:complete len:500 (+) Transcript_55333:23-1522(+)
MAANAPPHRGPLAPSPPGQAPGSAQQAVPVARDAPYCQRRHGGQAHGNEDAAEDCEERGREVVPALALLADLHGKGLEVVIEPRLGHLCDVQLRVAAVVGELVGVAQGRHRAHHLEVVLPSLVQALSVEMPVVQERRVAARLGRHALPTAVVLGVLAQGFREGEVLDDVRGVGHGRRQVLVAAAGEELQVPGRPRHLQVAPRVAASLVLRVVRLPAAVRVVPRALHDAGDPLLDAGDAPHALEAREGAVRLVEPDAGEGVDALLAADVLEVDAIHLDNGENGPGVAVAVLVLLAHDPLGQVPPHRRELPAVAAPLGEEVDEREVVVLDDVLEALVPEPVVAGGPVCVQVLLAVCLLELRCQPLVLYLLVVLLVVLVERVAAAGDAHVVAGRAQLRQLVALRLRPDRLLAEVVHDQDLQMLAIDRAHVDVEVDLHQRAPGVVQQQGGVGLRLEEGGQLAEEDHEHHQVGHDREAPACHRGLHAVRGQEPHGERSRDHRAD